MVSAWLVALPMWQLTDAGLQLIDVSDPKNPSLLGSFNTGFAYGVSVVGNIAYVVELM